MLREAHIKYLLVIPVIICLTLISIIPFIDLIRLSFYDVTILNYYNPPFCGIKNYIKILSDFFTHRALTVTLIYMSGVIIVEFLIGFGLALLLNRVTKGKSIIIILLLLPSLISPAVVGYMFRLMLNDLYGVITLFLKALLKNTEFSLLGSRDLALPVVMAIDVWEWTPFVFLILYAGLQALPRAPFEAAVVDGASGWQILRHITIPLLKPTIAVALVLRSMEAFKTFDIIWILTKGGPGIATETLSIYIYRLYFMRGDFGSAIALSVLVLMIVTVISKAYIKYLYRLGV